MDINHNLDRLFSKFTDLEKVTDALNQNNIKYGVYAGAYLYCAHFNSFPSDVDIFVSGDNYDMVKDLLIDIEIDDTDEYQSFTYGENRSIEFLSNLRIKQNSHRYNFSFTNLAWENTSQMSHKQYKIRFCNPVDTILAKAVIFASTGKKPSKYLSYMNLAKEIRIDLHYARKRLDEILADNYLKKIVSRDFFSLE